MGERVPLGPLSLPAPGHIHVWRLTISEAPSAALLPFLSSDERDRAARFVFARDRTQFVTTRGWLRTLLGAYRAQSPAAIQFQYGPEGKPSIATDEGSTPLHFNISHSGNVALFAVSGDRDLGVDVEQLSPRLDPEPLAPTIFAPDELRALRASAPHDQRAVFFRYWTAKEAYIKACGGGLSIPLQAFTVQLDDATPPWRISLEGNVLSSIVVQPVPVPVGYAGALAASGQWILHLRDLDATAPVARA